MSLEFGWMRSTLESLFDSLELEQVKSALTSDEARTGLRDSINAGALANGRLGRIPDGQYGDNLFQGLLALRIKFDRATAMDKLEVNLAMRAKRSI